MTCEYSNTYYDTKGITIVTIQDFSKICRTCLSDKNLTSIFDLVIGNVNATYLLEYSVQLQATQKDNLPINICESCLKELYKIYEFKQQCYENEALLTRIVNETKARDVEHDNIVVIIKDEDCEVIIKDNEDCDVIIKDNDDCDIEDHSDQVHHDKASEHCEEIEEKADVQKLLKLSGPGEDHKEKQGLHYGTVEQKCSKAAGPPYICTTCSDPEKYETVEELRKHRRKSHGQTHVCEMCHKTFNQHGLLKRHMTIHTKERRYECNVCLKKFGFESNLKRHELIHTGKRPYVCSVCGKGFIQLTSLHVHEKICCGDLESCGYNYKCQVCGRIYKRLRFYNAHLEQHLSENTTTEKEKQFPLADSTREHVCHVCARAYQTRKGLLNHLLIHGKKNNFCGKCGKAFYSQNSLRFHLKLHTGDKPYTCTECNKSFALLSTLNKHALTHSGHKPHSCSLCSKRFTSSTHLKRHMRTHNGERPYVCDYCDAAFALKDNLKVHVRKHTGETPYVCSICEKGFYDSSSMKRHKKKHFPLCTGTENSKMDCDAKAGVETKTD